ncbi:MAG: hypothetical protein HC796_10790 [Synechococcaceae cyanobacterium RL_1_2]|nr:hypothetical protein [Synechococcaceae cyanobacterium RL_1_2]
MSFNVLNFHKLFRIAILIWCYGDRGSQIGMVGEDKSRLKDDRGIDAAFLDQQKISKGLGLVG